MDYRALPIGISDFAEMIQKEFYYVDKTLMIKELLDSKTKVTLFWIKRQMRQSGRSWTGSMMPSLEMMDINTSVITALHSVGKSVRCIAGGYE